MIECEGDFAQVKKISSTLGSVGLVFSPGVDVMYQLVSVILLFNYW